jgi:hypothetical protein
MSRLMMVRRFEIIFSIDQNSFPFIPLLKRLVHTIHMYIFIVQRHVNVPMHATLFITQRPVRFRQVADTVRPVIPHVRSEHLVEVMHFPLMLRLYLRTCSFQERWNGLRGQDEKSVPFRDRLNERTQNAHRPRRVEDTHPCTRTFFVLCWERGEGDHVDLKETQKLTIAIRKKAFFCVLWQSICNVGRIDGNVKTTENQTHDYAASPTVKQIVQRGKTLLKEKNLVGANPTMGPKHLRKHAKGRSTAASKCCLHFLLSSVAINDNTIHSHTQKNLPGDPHLLSACCHSPNQNECPWWCAGILVKTFGTQPSDASTLCSKCLNEDSSTSCTSSRTLVLVSLRR